MEIKCKTCEQIIVKEWRNQPKKSPLLFCCRACSNKRNHSEESKSKISATVKSSIHSSQRDSGDLRKCIDCDNQIYVGKSTPSYKGRCVDCRKVLEQNNKILRESFRKILMVCAACGEGFHRLPSKTDVVVCSSKCAGTYAGMLKRKEQSILFDEGKLKYRNKIRRILVERFGCICQICNNTEWQHQPIPLQVDHVDGNASNNTPENLRLVCYNCAALLPTFAGRNKGSGRKSRGLKAYE